MWILNNSGAMEYCLHCMHAHKNACKVQFPQFYVILLIDSSAVDVHHTQNVFYCETLNINRTEYL